ncbi:hypothetical protein KP509_28G056800 [Ceratopteris richardii]|uniref:Uncharacterized protein n=1 Tax=Ceratopteris richardii TaxID=49495 RepID=A0A8T2RF05_CERRI|nr:hypothetical protein KP509_28G056800 [Ceratopteris richardii]
MELSFLPREHSYHFAVTTQFRPSTHLLGVQSPSWLSRGISQSRSARHVRSILPASELVEQSSFLQRTQKPNGIFCCVHSARSAGQAAHVEICWSLRGLILCRTPFAEPAAQSRYSQLLCTGVDPRWRVIVLHFLTTIWAQVAQG